MKEKKIVFKLLLLLVMIVLVGFSGINSVLAVPDSVYGHVLKTLSGSSSDILGSGSLLFTRKTATSGSTTYVAYCIQPTVDFAKDSVCTKMSNLDSSVMYTLGYYGKNDNASLTDKEYFITQMALWYLLRNCPTSGTNVNCYSSEWSGFNAFVFNFSDPSKSTYRGATADVAAQIATIVKGAVAATLDVEPSISINDSAVSFKKSGSYYVSSEISVTSVNINGNYTLALSNAPSGTLITDTSGNSKSSFAQNEKFLVKIPASAMLATSNTYVSVTASATSNAIYDAYGYDCASNSQDITIIDPRTIPVSDSAKFSLTVNSVKISKIDITTKEELPGAHLVVKDSSGKIIDEWTSTTEPHFITDLAPGVYTLTETISPDGYVLSTEVQEFTITNGGDIPTIFMTNALTELEISKVSLTTGKELPGAHLVLKDKDGNIVDEWDSTNESHIIKGLTPGVYNLTETISPDGYVLNTETVTVVIRNDGTSDKVIMKNELTKVEISKQDAVTKKELPGAHLVLKDKDGNIIDEWVSEDTPHVISGLSSGEYYLTETISPDGYELNKETVTLTIRKDGTSDKVIMYNDIVPEPVPTGDVAVILLVTFALFALGVGYYFYKRKLKEKK